MGVVSGLVGVGGGIVMVPLLYFLFGNPSLSGILLSQADHAVVAHATSLFVIVPTAVAGIRAYHREGLVDWPIVFPMAGTAVLAAVAGVQIAVRLPPEALKAGFGLFLVVSGVPLLVSSRDRREGRRSRRRPFAFAVAGGILVGLITALLGVGGGIVAIPSLIYIVGLDVKKVAATSLGIVVFSAVAAARRGVALNRRLKPSALTVLGGAVFLFVGFRIVLASAPSALT